MDAVVIEIAGGQRRTMHEPGGTRGGAELARDRHHLGLRPADCTCQQYDDATGEPIPCYCRPEPVRRAWSSNAALIDPADALRAARRERIEG